jgi:hypothetical protein
MSSRFAVFALACFLSGTLFATEPDDPLRPYTGPSTAGVDRSTLTGKVMTGYQGWFNCEGDGANLGWTHWAHDLFQPLGPGNVSADLWPDLSELTPEERFPTGFTLPDGSAAEAFSSFHRETVLRHFRWMREYGIDGAFVQRFANGLRNKILRHHKDVVLANCREGANREGRAYAVMYDLSGIRGGETSAVMEDWLLLREKMKIGEDPAYLLHRGKPLVALWGIGFNDDRKYTLTECHDLVGFFKAEGCSVMIGAPTGWRELDRDALPDPALHGILRLADVVSPWTVGRYRNPEEVERHADKVWKPDLEWCRQEKLDYLPVVFPGFSWHNLNPESPIGEIPRLGGEFLWSQFAATKAAGADMIYVAMFDEVDEGTAIFKCTNEPPVGTDPFLTYEGLPPDQYLWLTGEGGRLLRGELGAQSKMPERK